MRYLIPLAAATVVVAAAASAQVVPNASSSSSGASSASSDATASASSSSSPDCPTKPGAPAQPIRHDPTGRTTSSCFNPYVKQPGTSSASSSASSGWPH